MAHHNNSEFLLDTLLYCSEDHWDQDEHEEDDDESIIINSPHSSLIETDMLYNDDDHEEEEEELRSLLAKDQHNELFNYFETNSGLETDRKEAVQWMLKVNAHFSFSVLTALLAVNYLDRFLFSFRFQNNKKPWMTHLAAIACLSLAAKVEETKVPILSDLQVEESRFWFEAKTIKRMEILVLSTLEWKMNPATPLSFIDYIIRRLRLKDHLCLELFKKCESVLLSLITDSRFMSYLPSVLATATLMHVINNVDIKIGYQSLLGILGTNNEEKVDECRKVILELLSGLEQGKKHCSMKRKFGSIPSSPNGVIDVFFSSDNNSNDSWTVSASVSSSPKPFSKKTKTQDQNLLNPFNSDFVTIPRL